MRRRDVTGLLFALGTWAAAVAFIRPYGEFPLNDDWDFALATWNFARTGHFQFTAFTAVSLRAMVLWGAAWTRLFGRSFLVLRFSTMTLAALTLVLVYEILRLGGVPLFGRVVATLAFAFHPLFLWSSCTYMTEVPFLCASSAALLLIWRGLERPSGWMIAAGCAAAIVSCFVRQTGVLNIVAPLTVVVFLPKKRRFAPILIAAVALFAAIHLFRPGWLSASPAAFATHYKMWRESSFRLPQQIALAYHYFVFNAQNSALFFLPLVVPLVFLFRKRAEFALLVSAGLIVLLRVQSLINTGLAMPYFAYASPQDILQGNLFTDLGLGPPTLADVWSLQNPYPFHLTAGGKLTITYLSVIAAALSVSAILLSLRKRNLLVTLAVTFAAVSTAALVASGYYTDRYSLDSCWSLGIVLALIVPWEKRSARALAVVALAAIAVFATLSVQEYFAWNRARWAGFDWLRGRGVAVAQIDGGSEIGNWFEVSKMTLDQARKVTMFSSPRPYMLTFGPLPGYQTIARFPFEGWVGLHRGAVLVLKRAG